MTIFFKFFYVLLNPAPIRMVEEDADGTLRSGRPSVSGLEAPIYQVPGSSVYDMMMISYLG